MTQRPVPFLLMRGGTSRGPYFRRSDLPADRDALSEVLMAVIGAGHPHTIDGLGGGIAVATKVAMLSPPEEPDTDVDYLFAQVGVDRRLVDYGPTCGNILVGVGPAAIEMGLVPAVDPETRVRIRAVNTGAAIEAVVRTPGGVVTYDGDTAIAGVPGTAAPVELRFLGTVGGTCGAALPTGSARERIDGVAVTCMDVAMPMMIARARDLGLTGYETASELDADRALFARLEAMRLEAGRRMGLGDVTHSVIPKIGLVAPPRHGGTLSARYLMPWRCHPTVAVTGSQCLAACALLPGTVAHDLAAPVAGSPAAMAVEHPEGALEVTLDYALGCGGIDVRWAAVVRTARLVARGEAMVPASAWPAGSP